MLMSAISSPRLGIAPSNFVNASVSLVTFSSRKRSCGSDGKCGRQIVLNPLPCQFPSSWASGP